MTYPGMIAAAVGGPSCPRVSPAVKALHALNGLSFPVLLCREREDRPFRHYKPYTHCDCPLCARVNQGRVVPGIVPGMVWLAATYPIKSHHAICYPREHRACILREDIENLGRFADEATDAVICLNMRGSAASIPEHFHVQIHDDALPEEPAPVGGGQEPFPLLSRPLEPFACQGPLRLYRVPSYPAFTLVLEGPWALVAEWLTMYIAGSNQRPHNFAMTAGGKLFVLPRGLEKAPSQENRYGASEMLGLITPVTAAAYEAIQTGESICEALRVCGLTDPREILGAEEHACWVLGRVGGRTGAADGDS